LNHQEIRRNLNNLLRNVAGNGLIQVSLNTGVQTQNRVRKGIDINLELSRFESCTPTNEIKDSPNS